MAAEAEAGHEAGHETGEQHHDTKKDKRNHQLTIAAVAVGIVGAVFAWLSFRKSSGGNVPYTYPAMPATTGTLAASGSTGQQQQNLLAGLEEGFGSLYKQNTTHFEILFDQLKAGIPAGAGVGNGVTPGEQNFGGAPSQLGGLPPSSPFGAPNMPGAAPTPGPLFNAPISSVFGQPIDGGGYTQPDPSSWAPTTVAGGSIMAPPGGILSWGHWEGNRLVSGTYQLPNGQFQSVG